MARALAGADLLHAFLCFYLVRGNFGLPGAPLSSAFCLWSQLPAWDGLGLLVCCSAFGVGLRKMGEGSVTRIREGNGWNGQGFVSPDRGYLA